MSKNHPAKSCQSCLRMFENIRADLRCYEGNWTIQGFWVMVAYRFGRWQLSLKPSLFKRPLRIIYKILFRLSQILTGIELPCETVVGRNFLIHHFGGIVISAAAVFGDNCHIRNGVTIGEKRMYAGLAPRIGNNVNIGANAVILGDIRIGDNAVIGANSVVLTDVPEGALAVGNPAKIIPKDPKAEQASDVAL